MITKEEHILHLFKPLEKYLIIFFTVKLFFSYCILYLAFGQSKRQKQIKQIVSWLNIYNCHVAAILN